MPVKNERLDASMAWRNADSTLAFSRLGSGLRFSRQSTTLPEPPIDIEAPFDFQEAYPYLTAQWARSDWANCQNYRGIKRNKDIDLVLSI